MPNARRAACAEKDLSTLGFLSYPLLFVRWPITRDLPWVNLLLFVAAIALTIACGLAVRVVA